MLCVAFVHTWSDSVGTVRISFIGVKLWLKLLVEHGKDLFYLVTDYGKMNSFKPTLWLCGFNFTTDIIHPQGPGPGYNKVIFFLDCIFPTRSPSVTITLVMSFTAKQAIISWWEKVLQSGVIANFLHRLGMYEYYTFINSPHWIMNKNFCTSAISKKNNDYEYHVLFFLNYIID